MRNDQFELLACKFDKWPVQSSQDVVECRYPILNIAKMTSSTVNRKNNIKECFFRDEIAFQMREGKMKY